MKNDLDLMRLFFDLNGICRYNFVEGGFRVLQSQTVAAHTAGVAFYALVIASALGLKSPEQQWAILAKALMHDLGEVHTGDLPYILLKENPDLERLLHQISSRGLQEDFRDSPLRGIAKFDNDCLETNIVKLADKLDVYLFFEKELALGNETVRQFFPRLINTMQELVSKILKQDGGSGACQLLKLLADSWYQHVYTERRV